MLPRRASSLAFVGAGAQRVASRLLGHDSLRSLPASTAATVQGSEPSDGGRGVLPSGLSAAVLVERLPVVLPKPPQWVLEYAQFSFERSQHRRKTYPSGFLEAAAEAPSDETKLVLAPGQVDIQTTTDMMSFYEDPSRITEADRNGDTRSTHRALDRRLYLVVNGSANGHNAGGSNGKGRDAEAGGRWRLPEASYEAQDSLKQCAEDALRPFLSSELDRVYFVGNAPFAHLESRGEEAGDSKRFFFWAHWVDFEATFQGNSHAWLTKEELMSSLEGTPEKPVLDSLLLD